MPVIPVTPTYKIALSGGKIIKRALRVIGAIGTGDNPSASEQTDALEALNGMLDAWNTEDLTVPARTKTAKVLTPGTQSYTIGEAGVIDVARPPQIVAGDAMVLDGSLEFPLTVFNGEQWAGIYQKAVTSARPSVLYYEATAPLGTIYLWQIPDAAYTLNLWLPTL